MPSGYSRRTLIGYARVSTAEQNPDHQVDALQRAGVNKNDIYVDHASGAKASRPRGVGLHVVEQGIDTTTAEGRAMFGMLSVLAELQRELIIANTRDGLAAARAREAKADDDPSSTQTRPSSRNSSTTLAIGVQQIADLFSVPRTTVYGHLDSASKGKRPTRQQTPAKA